MTMSLMITFALHSKISYLFLIFLLGFMCAYVYVCMYAGTHRSQESALDYQEVVTGYYKLPGMLGTKLRSSRKIVGNLNS